jgi:uncharacterized membrane protein YheB (UPF0754 family)
MLRRITIIAIEEFNGDEAIQPKRDKQISELLNAVLDNTELNAKTREASKLGIEERSDASMLASERKEKINGDKVLQARLDHQAVSISGETVTPAKKEVAGSAEEIAAEPESDQRLVKLIKEKVKQLLDALLQEAPKEIAKKVVSLIFHLLWILGGILLLIMRYIINQL